MKYKPTAMDVLVIFMAIFTLCSHAFTMYAVNWHVQKSGVSIADVVEVLEQSPGTKTVLQLDQFANIMWLIIWASIFALWFAYVRKIQFTEKKDLCMFVIMILFFCTAYAFVNDLASVIGLAI
jgi:hypothetical protein